MDRIPEISDEKLESLMEKIKPVIRYSRRITGAFKLVKHSEGDLYFIEPVDPREIAFTWEPKPTKFARNVNPEPYKSIGTYHNYGAPVLFKPSIAEVLAQIPEEDIKRCVAFETISEGLDGANCLPEGCHVTTTRLYEKVHSAKPKGKPTPVKI